MHQGSSVRLEVTADGPRGRASGARGERRCSVPRVINASRSSSGNGAGEDVSDRGFISRKHHGVTAREFGMINAFACTVADNLLNVGSRVSCSIELAGKGKP